MTGWLLILGMILGIAAIIYGARFSFEEGGFIGVFVGLGLFVVCFFWFFAVPLAATIITWWF